MKRIRATNDFGDLHDTLVLLYGLPKPSRLPAPLEEPAKAIEKSGAFENRPFETVERVLPNGGALLLVGAGDERDAEPAQAGVVHQRGAVAAVATAKRLGLTRISLGVPSPSATRAIVRGLALALSDGSEGRAKAKEIRVDLVGTSARHLDEARAEAEGVLFAREIVDLPPNEKPPEALAALVRKRFRGTGVAVEVVRASALKKQGYNAILAVGRGAANPPVLVRMSWKPKGATRRTRGVLLVGKGVTFDSGGLNIKSDEGMKTMKADCGGAAAVCGAVLAAAKLRLPARVEGLVAFVENMPGGSAYKPGDVVRTKSGKTIEILNTDAEGRVILADLLHEAAERMKSDAAISAVVDLATLTGACMVALGEDRAGLFSPDAAFRGALESASAAAGEYLWPLPLGPEHHEAVKSKVADVKNTGPRHGGASNAAAFLAAFAPKPPKRWAHLDIAGPAFVEKEGAGKVLGGTGFGVATLVELARRLGVSL